MDIKDKVQNCNLWLNNHFGEEIFSPRLGKLKDFINSWVEKINTKKPTIIIVAGTNGKGECAHYLASQLFELDKKVGLWTSPHILTVRERFIFNDKAIDEEKCLELFISTYAKMHERNLQLSYYEFLFAVFCRYISSLSTLDYLILEVGLGGRLDAVNIFDADYVLLTSIARDHQQFLGNSYQKILNEKLGVTRRGCQLLSAIELRCLQQKIYQHAIENSYNACDLFRSGHLNKNMPYFERNQILVLSLLKELGLCKNLEHSQNMQRKPLRRWCKKTSKYNYYFYGAHNIDGMRKLVQFLSSTSYNDDRPGHYDLALVSFSKRDSKDIVVMFKNLLWLYKKGIISKIKIVAGEFAKAISFLEIQSLLKEEIDKDYVDIFASLSSALDSNNEQEFKSQNILVTGSYYFIGDVQSLLGETA